MRVSLMVLCVLAAVVGSSLMMGEAAADCGGKLDWQCQYCGNYSNIDGCEYKACNVFVMGGCHGIY